VLGAEATLNIKQNSNAQQDNCKQQTSPPAVTPHIAGHQPMTAFHVVTANTLSVQLAAIVYSDNVSVVPPAEYAGNS